LKSSKRLSSLKSIVEALKEDGILSESDAVRASGGSVKTHPIQAVASMQLLDQRTLDQAGKGKILTDDALSHWYAENVGLEYFQINPLKMDVEAITQVMSYAYASSNKILCVEVRPSEVLIATADPDKDAWIQSIEQTTKKKVKKVFCSPENIDKYLVEFYSIAKSVSGADDGEAKAAAAASISNFEQLLDLTGDREVGADDKHIVNIVDWLLQYAFSQRASDIHIEPRREIGCVRFRIDGVLHDVYEMPRHVTNAVTSRIKVLGRMDVAEKRRPQDGRIKTRMADGGEVELRLSTLPTAFGEKLVMRIFDPEVLLRSFEDMGLAGKDGDIWEGMIGRTSGIVLVTGPTGSGKTTTLYTSLRQIATKEVNVSTLEDPIEMVVDQFNQTQVQPKIGLDFATGVRTLLRQDPDVIMVGEIRDLETAEMAVQAALTGHLVISTLHTNDAASAITRLQDLGLPAHLIRVTLNGVMAQRLVRKLCTHCREEVEPVKDAWETLVKPFKADMPKKIYKAVGCLECRNTGYMGREGIYEFLQPTQAVRKQITDNCDLQTLRMQAYREGAQTLRLSGARKVAAGVTTIEEVLRVTPTVEDF
jgi:general secretion pathway protein E